MYDLDTFVVAVYCLVVEELYARFCQRYGKPRRAGFEPALSDAECLTIEIVGQFLGYSTQKQLYERMHDRFGEWFPGLTDRVAFARQSANLWQVKLRQASLAASWASRTRPIVCLFWCLALLFDIASYHFVCGSRARAHNQVSSLPESTSPKSTLDAGEASE